jgi:esterase/lipase
MNARDHQTKIVVDTDSIRGTFITPGAALPGVLFVHGWGGSQQQYLARARETAALGCVCLAFDLRGHADTLPQRETVSRESNLRDVLAAYDALVMHPQVDRSSIAVIGSSYGGYLATILTTMRPVRWLALRVPALYMDSGWELPKTQLHKEQDLDAYRRSLIQARDNRALRSCSEFEGDVLIIESQHDNVVPHTVIANYLEAFIKPHSLTYRVLEGADHGLTHTDHQRSYTALLLNWLQEMVFGARAGESAAPAIGADDGGIAEGPPEAG